MSRLRPRVAWFSPLAPDPSGISAYSELLLPLLAESWDLTLFVDGYAPTEPFAATLPFVDCGAEDPLPLLPSFDAVVYQMGNSGSHAYIYDTLMAWPGLVVMHELSIHHFVAGRTAAAGRIDLYLREVRAQLGDAAAEEARRAFYDSIDGPWETRPIEFPMNRRVLDQATGVLCHSRFVRDAIEHVHPKLAVVRADHPAWPHDRTAAPRREEPDAAPLRLVAAGNLTANKSIEEIIVACGLLAREHDLELRLVGNLEIDADLDVLCEVTGCADRVQALGRVSDETLMRELEEADLVFCMRSPTLGETSGIVLRTCSVGTPVVVSDVGWFREIPDEVAIKIPAPLASAEDLARQLSPFLGDGADLAARGDAALAWAEAATPEKTARAYLAWVEEAGRFPHVMTGRAFGLAAEIARELDMEFPAEEALARAELFRQLLREEPAARPDWLYPPEHLAPVARAPSRAPSAEADRPDPTEPASDRER